MPAPSLADLPPPPPGRTGWPWTQSTPPLPPTRPDGTPWPSVAIVTPSFSQGRFIEETIRSILLQGYPKLSYAIIDGGSKDETVAIIERYGRWIDYWVSEPDRGQAHAINKGLAVIDGDVFNFLNSDDLLLPGALRMIGELWQPGRAIGAAITNFRDRDGLTVRTIRNEGLTAVGIIGGGKAHVFHQPGFWFDCPSLRQIEPFDERLHFVFDWELAIRYLDRFPAVSYCDAPCAKFRVHDAAKSTSRRDRFVRERWRALRNLMRQPQYAHLRPACRRRLMRMAWPVLRGAIADRIMMARR